VRLRNTSFGKTEVGTLPLPPWRDQLTPQVRHCSRLRAIFHKLMPSISFRILLCAALVLCASLLLVTWRSRCLHDGSTSVLCVPSVYTRAAMSASLLSLPASLVRQTSRYRMPQIVQRGYASNASAKTSFTYRLGAASVGKRTSPRPAKLGQDFWPYASTQVKPSPPYLRSTKKDSGEDAFFATTVGGSYNNVAFGVADGVGGWQDQGVDPSHFSHGLCGLMAGTAYANEGLAEGINVRPRELLQIAYDAVMHNPRILAGGCTASLAVANEHGSIETAKYVNARPILLTKPALTASVA